MCLTDMEGWIECEVGSNSIFRMCHIEGNLLYEQKYYIKIFNYGILCILKCTTQSVHVHSFLLQPLLKNAAVSLWVTSLFLSSFNRHVSPCSSDVSCFLSDF